MTFPSLLLPRPLPAARCAAAGQVILQQEHILHCVVFIQKGLVDLSVQASAVNMPRAWSGCGRQGSGL